MSTTRILVLGMLAERGPMHGHQLRRYIELTGIEVWGDVRAGSLYGALHRMDGEGLIVPVRSEQEGNFPARTVYAITGEGRLELLTLRQRALQEARLAPDPFDVALTVADLPVETLAALIDQRRRTLQTELDQLIAERERLQAGNWLSTAHYATFRHRERRCAAELAFLDELAPLLPQIASEHASAKAMEVAETTPVTDIIRLESQQRRRQRRAPNR